MVDHSHCDCAAHHNSANFRNLKQRAIHLHAFLSRESLFKLVVWFPEWYETRYAVKIATLGELPNGKSCFRKCV